MSRNHSSKLSAETSVIPGGRLLEIWRIEVSPGSNNRHVRRAACAAQACGARRAPYLGELLAESLGAQSGSHSLRCYCFVGVVEVAVAASWSVPEEGVRHDWGV